MTNAETTVPAAKPARTRASAGRPAILEVEDLRLTIATGSGDLSILKSVNLSVLPGEALGIVGESGSGKSMTASAILGLLPLGAELDGGSVRFDGTDIGTAPEEVKRSLRGRRIGTILQDPNASLNPVMRAGPQVTEPLRVHEYISRAKAHERAVTLLDRVGILKAESRARDYPHQFSGGMRQRLVGAAAIACEPALIIADEPTTALDVTVQAAYLALLNDLRAELDAAMLFISHDLSVVARVCDRVSVMYAGSIVESSSTRALFSAARHPYTMGLISCLPSITEIGQQLTPIPGNPPDPREQLVGCAFASRCPAAQDVCRTQSPELVEIEPGHSVACHRAEEGLTSAELWPVLPSRISVREAVQPGPPVDTSVRVPTLALEGVTKTFAPARSVFSKRGEGFTAVNDVDLQVFRGESVSVVGESGSGKTTCIRMVLGLEKATSGRILFNGHDISRLRRAEMTKFRQGVQAVFQDPFTSFDPRMSIARAVAEPLVELGEGLSRNDIRDRVDETLALVGLDPIRVRDVFPHQLSGGQRQRVAIARALGTRPDCLVLDEPVSALDVSIRVQVLNLLKSIQETTGVGILAISHDLGAVKYMSDRVIVMRRGVFVEEGTAEQIYHDPQHEYTKQLLADAAVGHDGLDAMIRTHAETPPPIPTPQEKK